MKTAWVIEDQPPLASWLIDILEQTFPGIEVQHADTLGRARGWLNEADDHEPQLVLVDLHLPDGIGSSLIPEILHRYPRCQCIVATVYADDRHLFPALRAGAAGYLLKDQPADRIAQSLRDLAAGQPPLSASVARRLLRAFAGESSEGGEGMHTRISPREQEALSLIARGYKTAEVAKQMGVSLHTANDFIKSVYRKLQISNRAQATLEAARLGLIDPQM